MEIRNTSMADITRPIEPFDLTQIFGVNPKTYAQFGLNGHNGWDFKTKFPDTPEGFRNIWASWLSQFYRKGHDRKGYGHFFEVIIRLKSTWKLTYAHCKSIETFAMKNEGESMAISDNTGFSTGSHLHLTTKRIKMVGGKVQVLDHGNGYFGAVNPQEFFDEVREAKHHVKPEPSMDPLNYVPTKKDYERLAVWHKKPTESWTVEDIIREWRAEKEQQEALREQVETADGVAKDAQKKAAGLQGQVNKLTEKNADLVKDVADLKEEVKELKAELKAKPKSRKGVSGVPRVNPPGGDSVNAYPTWAKVLWRLGRVAVATAAAETIVLKVDWSDPEVAVRAVVAAFVGGFIVALGKGLRSYLAETRFGKLLLKLPF